MTPSCPSDSAASPAHACPLTLIAIAATVLLAGALVGAGTNAVNGTVSPAYFISIMGWHHVADVWRASIAQGILEGLLVGSLFALIFTSTIGIITRAACPYALALRYLLAIMAAALGCWAIGGLIAMGLATLSPEFYRSTFIGVPRETGDMLRYAWVGGSIWGVQIGALLAVIISLVLFRARWRRQV